MCATSRFTLIYKKILPTSLRLIGLFAVFFFTTVGLAYFFLPVRGDEQSLKSTDIAGWVQAIGSIAAIWTGFRVAAKQSADARRHAEIQREEIRQEQDLNAHAVVKLLYDYATEIHKYLHHPDWNARTFFSAWDVFIANNAATGLNAFDKVPLHQLGNAGRIMAAAGVRSGLQSILVYVSRATKSPTMTAEKYKILQEDVTAYYLDLKKGWDIFDSTFEYANNPP